jgi:hypothetical protein
MRIIIVILIALLILTAIYVAFYPEKLILTYIVNTYIPVRPLPQNWIAPALERVTGLEFPVKISNAKGFFEGGRDHCIFVRSQLDTNDVSPLVEFLSKNSTVTKANHSYLEEVKCRGYTFFPDVLYWEKEYKFEKLFDINSLGAGTLIENTDSRGYTAFVDEENKVLYIYAYWF